MFRWYSPPELLSLPFSEFLFELGLPVAVESIPCLIDLCIDSLLDHFFQHHRRSKFGRGDRDFLLEELILRNVLVDDVKDDLGDAGADDQA